MTATAKKPHSRDLVSAVLFLNHSVREARTHGILLALPKGIPLPSEHRCLGKPVRALGTPLPTQSPKEGPDPRFITAATVKFKTPILIQLTRIAS